MPEILEIKLAAEKLFLSCNFKLRQPRAPSNIHREGKSGERIQMRRFVVGIAVG